MEKLEVRNNMSAAALVAQQHDVINFVENPNTHKVFFTCGSITGYVSPKAQNANSITELQYAECRKPGETKWVPCLSTKSTTNVKKTFGAELV